MTVTHAQTETTDNLLGTQWDTTGAVQQTDSLVRFSYTQGVARQEIDLSDYDNVESLTYGAGFIGCNNFIGGHCGSTNPAYYDQVVVKLYVGDQIFEQTVTTNYNQGVVNHEWTAELTESADSAILQFSGYDPGYWAGWYGAIVLEPYLKANYSWAVLEPVINPTPIVPDTVAEEDTAADLVAGGILTEVITAPVSLDVTPVTIEPEIAAPAAMPVTPAAPQTVVERVEGDTSESLGETSVSSDPAPAEQVEQQEEMAEVVAEVKAEGGKISVKSIAAQMGNAYNPMAQGVMMALMQAPKITQPNLADALFYVDRGLKDRSLNDRAWRDTLVSEVKWNKMVDSEWQR